MPPLRTITQEVIFKATPIDVYLALMDSERHSSFTESAATISPKVDGTISAYDGYIAGSNVKLVPGKTIVQRWRADTWPTGHYSTLSITLKKVGNKTELHFVQTGVPGEFYTDISAGWKKHYWERMKLKFGW